MTVVHGLGVCLPVPGAGMPADGVAAGLRSTVRMARVAESAGFATLWVPDSGTVDPIVVLGALAQCTGTATVGAMVGAAGRRQPAVLAKEMTTIDVLSSGRAALALGVPPLGVPALGVPALGVPPLGVSLPESGDVAESGVPLPQSGDEAESTVGIGGRVARLQQALAVCRAMFRDPPVTMSGTYVAVNGAANRPAPVSGLGPPLLVGLAGRGRALAGVAGLVDGVVVGGDRIAVEGTRRAVDAACGVVGRDHGEVAVVVRRAWRGPVSRFGRDHEDGGRGCRDEDGPGGDPRGIAAGPAARLLAAEVADLLAGPADGVVVDFSGAHGLTGVVETGAATTSTGRMDLDKVEEAWTAVLQLVAAVVIGGRPVRVSGSRDLG